MFTVGVVDADIVVGFCPPAFGAVADAGASLEGYAVLPVFASCDALPVGLAVVGGGAGGQAGAGGVVAEVVRI